MKYTVVSWNCNGGFRNKFLELLKAYPDADIFVVHECEDPYFYDVEDFKRLFNNGFRIGFKQKGIAVFARDGITLRRLDWPGDTCGFSYAPTLIDGAFTLLACWTHGNYVGELHDYLDANLEKFSQTTLMIGDLNSSVVFDKNPKQRSHSLLVERLNEAGLKPLYHHFSGDEQGNESVPTYYHLRKSDRPFHIDHAFADPNFVVSFEVAPLSTHASWLKLSDHMPLKVVFDTDQKPSGPAIKDDNIEERKRVVRPISELKKLKEEAAQPRMSIRMPDGKLICREKMTDTFRDFIMGMGWEDVRYLNFDVYGKDLITQEHPNGWYKELVPGWYVNTGMKANTMRTTAYEIARALGKKIVVSWD